MDISDVQDYLEKNYAEVQWYVFRNNTVYMADLRTPRVEVSGSYLFKPLQSLGQVDALAHLMLRTYLFRKNITINALHIKGDKSYRTQEELRAVLA